MMRETTSDAPAPTATLAEFEAWARGAGYDEVAVREWQPLQVVDDHGHPFAVHARVVQGEMWLTAEGHTQHLRPGDTFELGADVPHAERYGPDGATYWAARRARR